MKVQKQNDSRPAKITPEVLRKLQQAMSDVIKPDYKEHTKDAPKKKHKNKNKNNKK